MKITIFFACLLLTACAVAPPRTTSHTISIVGNTADAGIVRWTYDASGKVDGILVRDAYVNTYHWMVYVKKDGLKLKPPLTVATGVTADGDLWRVDLQAASNYARMVQMELNTP